MIDALEALKKSGLLAADQIVVSGASAGGVMVGRVVAERPDLLAGALMMVPVADSLLPIPAVDNHASAFSCEHWSQ